MLLSPGVVLHPLPPFGWFFSLLLYFGGAPFPDPPLGWCCRSPAPFGWCFLLLLLLLWCFPAICNNNVAIVQKWRNTHKICFRQLHKKRRGEKEFHPSRGGKIAPPKEGNAAPPYERGGKQQHLKKERIAAAQLYTRHDMTTKTSKKVRKTKLDHTKLDETKINRRNMHEILYNSNKNVAFKINTFTNDNTGCPLFTDGAAANNAA